MQKLLKAYLEGTGGGLIKASPGSSRRVLTPLCVPITLAGEPGPQVHAGRVRFAGGREHLQRAEWVSQTS